MAMLWLEPIMDSNSLIELSIVLLLIERVIGSIPRLDPKILAMERSTHASTPPLGGGSTDGSWFHVGGALLGSPFITVLGGFAMLLSCLANNAPYETRLFGPNWWRSLFLPRHESLMVGSAAASPGLLYFLLLLFCLEGMLLLSITMLGCHALTFPEWIEEDVKIVTSLMGVWLISLLASSSVRCCLYYSMGD